MLILSPFCFTDHLFCKDWTAPGSQKADGQLPMPDQDHSIAFWSSVAQQFKNNSAVIFDLFNEPFPGTI
jgi:aryl-phospho-beta-D-glucosidase BglC (GH1 family)